MQTDSSTDALSLAFAALADPTRRAILSRLAQGETSVGDLVKPFDISGPAISRHLRVLENARLIERRVDAQWRICKLHPPGLRVADDWLRQYRDFWEHSLDRLADVLEHPPAAGAESPAQHPPPDGARPSARRPLPSRARRSNHQPKRKSP